MSAENFNFKHLNTLENVFSSTTLSLISIHFDVSTAVYGVINTSCPPDCVQNVPIVYQTWTSQHQVPIKINPSFNNLDSDYQKIAIMGTLLKIAEKHENVRGKRIFPSLSYDDNLIKVSSELRRLISDWSEAPRGEINSRIKTLYTFG